MTRSKKLVVVDASGQVVTTSLKIAEGTDNEHRSIIRMIQNYQDKFERFGKIRFANVDLKSATKSIDTADNDKPRLSRDGRKKETTIAFLNEQQATFLITLLRNTELVVDFKAELVNQFYKMRQKLMEMPKEELAQKKIRRAGIDNARLPLTDVIKLFVERDKPADPRKYYSKVTYRIQMELCGIPKGGRDTSTGALLLKVGGLEQIARATLYRAFVEGKTFQTAFEEMDQAVTMMASFFDADVPAIHGQKNKAFLDA